MQHFRGVSRPRVSYDGNGGVAWTQFGSHLRGNTDGDEFGVAVSILGEGRTIAASAPGNNDNGLDAGHVRVSRRERMTLTT